MITDRIGLHSVLLPSLIVRRKKKYMKPKTVVAYVFRCIQSRKASLTINANGFGGLRAARLKTGKINEFSISYLLKLPVKS